jgi:hypothetical protein
MSALPPPKADSDLRLVALTYRPPWCAIHRALVTSKPLLADEGGNPLYLPGSYGIAGSRNLPTSGASTVEDGLKFDMNRLIRRQFGTGTPPILASSAGGTPP